VWEKIKTAFRWAYDWVTVLVASMVGLPDVLLQLLSIVQGVDISPLIGADKALKIVTAVAIAKAVLSLIESRGKVA
jgi:hypothetical protein